MRGDLMLCVFGASGRGCCSSPSAERRSVALLVQLLLTSGRTQPGTTKRRKGGEARRAEREINGLFFLFQISSARVRVRRSAIRLPRRKEQRFAIRAICIILYPTVTSINCVSFHLSPGLSFRSLSVSFRLSTWKREGARRAECTARANAIFVHP